MSPIIMKVAVPLVKHSPRLGQAASSQTVLSFCSRKIAFKRLTSGVVGAFARIQEGLRLISVLGITLIGILATLSAPRSFTPCSAFLTVLCDSTHFVLTFRCSDYM